MERKRKITISIDRKIAAAINALAKEEKRSLSNMIEVALNQYINCKLSEENK